MLLFSHLHILFGFNTINKHSILYKHLKSTPIIMSNENIEFISKYKYYFKKDNYNNIINNIIDHKVSKIYIDKKMNEIVVTES